MREPVVDLLLSSQQWLCLHTGLHRAKKKGKLVGIESTYAT